MHILILCYKVLIHDSVRRTWALYARAVRRGVRRAHAWTERNGARVGRGTLQGSWRVVLGCKPGSSGQLTACCCQALVHWRCLRYSSRRRSTRSRGISRELPPCFPPKPNRRKAVNGVLQTGNPGWKSVMSRNLRCPSGGTLPPGSLREVPQVASRYLSPPRVHPTLAFDLRTYGLKRFTSPCLRGPPWVL